MKIEIGVIYSSLDALKQLYNMKLDVHKAYQLRKIMSELQIELDAIEDIRKNLIKQYGHELDKTGRYQIEPTDTEGYNSFVTAMQALLSKEIDIDLKGLELGIDDLAGNKVEPAILQQLEWLIL